MKLVKFGKCNQSYGPSVDATSSSVRRGFRLRIRSGRSVRRERTHSIVLSSPRARSERPAKADPSRICRLRVLLDGAGPPDQACMHGMAASIARSPRSLARAGRRTVSPLFSTLAKYLSTMQARVSALQPTATPTLHWSTEYCPTCASARPVAVSGLRFDRWGFPPRCALTRVVARATLCLRIPERAAHCPNRHSR